MKPEPPAGAETHETELATLWIDADGILVSISKSPLRTIANTSENFALVKRLAGGRRIPHLVYLSKSGVPDKATRAHVSRELPKAYSAMAMVSDSGLGNLIMLALFKLRPPAIPMKSFRDAKAAKAWLMGFR